MKNHHPPALPEEGGWALKDFPSNNPGAIAMKRYSAKQMIQQYGTPDAAINAALEILRKGMRERGAALTSPGTVRDYLRLNLAPLEHEAFWCVWLDAQHRVIAAHEAFRGTLTQTSVYPREIAKQGLAVNAAAVIFAHNHPSGVAQPSRADEVLTRTLRDALSLFDIKVLDHFIFGMDTTMSFAERGLI
jgi:DNA repair protein RadC